MFATLPRGSDSRRGHGSGGALRRVRQELAGPLELRLTGRSAGTPWVADELVHDGLSLHAPLIVDFDNESIAMTSLRDGVDDTDAPSDPERQGIDEPGAAG